MGQKIRFGGAGLPAGSHTFFDDLSKANYRESDLLKTIVKGEAALQAMSRPGAQLFTAGFAGVPAAIAVEAAPKILAVDPELIWCEIPDLDERGVQKVREGAEPLSYVQTFVNFGDVVDLERVRNAESYLQRGMAQIVSDAPSSPKSKPAPVAAEQIKASDVPA